MRTARPFPTPATPFGTSLGMSLGARLGACAVLVAGACARTGARPAGALAPFGSESALAEYLQRVAPTPRGALLGPTGGAGGAAASMPAMAAAPSMRGTSAGAPKASLTNVQQAGVDEGGIVKRHGDHLVILRRGRLFTVAVGDGTLRPVAAVDAFAPGSDPADWYDEMLVSGDRVVVIGYSYARGGTEFGVFDIDVAGGLRHRATYDLRSDDYYASRNYASRLVGTKLIFYTPLALRPGGGDLRDVLPAMRRVADAPNAERGGGRRWGDAPWRDVGGADPRAGNGATRIAPFVPIAAPERVYRPAYDPALSGDLALHTVTVCDLAAAEVRCQATVVVGPSARVFYVSSTAVYVWTSEAPSGASVEGELATDDASGEFSTRHVPRRAPPRATLYRMPLDGSAPQALDVRGSPIDQFSFSEGDDGHLNVLVRAEAAGDGMWSAESAGGAAALLRVPLASFGDGHLAVPDSRYRPLPAPSGGVSHDRFVGTHLLYGAGGGWKGTWDQGERSRGASVYVVPVAGGAVATVALPHGVDRIEAMGADAVVVGTAGRDLHFTGVRLRGRPAAAQHFVLPNAAQGELRSHGFFYREDGDGMGVLGLPVRAGGAPGGVAPFESSAAIEYVRNAGGRFTDLGVLAAGDAAVDDACRVSCEDWYGNARPLFLGRRTLALLGYELVEGRIDGGRVREVQRVRFAPRVTLLGARW